MVLMHNCCKDNKFRWLSISPRTGKGIIECLECGRTFIESGADQI